MQSTIKSITEKVNLYKCHFEYNYYKYTRVYDKITTSKINLMSTILISFVIGVLYNTILTTWKSMNQWSFVELGSITYFSFHAGSRMSENIHEYLLKVSKGLFDHSKYNFTPLKPVKASEGDSYLNPIDLTMDMAEEREALEALVMLSNEDCDNTSEKRIKTE